MLELVNPKVRDVVRFGAELVAFRARFGAWNLLDENRATELAVDRFCTPRGRRGTLETRGLLEDLTRFAKNAETPDPADVQRLLESARRDRVTARGHGLRVYRWSPPAPRGRVLFAHGWEGYALNFGPAIHALHEEGFEVVAFDNIAHGESEGARSSLPEFVWGLEAVIEQTGSYDFTVGHSLGGAALLQCLCRGSLAADEVIAIAPFADMDRITRQWSGLYGLGSGFGPRLLDGIIDRYGYSIELLDTQYLAQGIQVPVTIVHDRDDPIVPIRTSRSLAGASPHVRLVEVEGAGHIGSLFHPETENSIRRSAERVRESKG
ncbi:MAG: alpha/beta fold hydrolase [Myxococcota bacterium]